MKASRLIELLAFVLCSSLAFAGCGDDDDNDTADDDAGDDDTLDDDTTDDDTGDDDAADDDTGTETPSLRVGFARVDITPEISVMMAGYGMSVFSENLCRWSTGKHDPLYVSAIAVEDPNGEPLVFMVFDLVGVITNEIVRIQQGLADALGIEANRVVVAATHNHHGPDMIGLWGVIFPPQTGRIDAVVEQVVAGGIQAGLEAWEARVPATLEFAIGSEPAYHFNNVFLDPDRLVDDTMTVLAAYDENGAILGSLMNWSSHVTMMGADNTLLSADFPGAYYRSMDESLGGTHLFVNGAIGASIQPLAVEDPWLKWLFGNATWDDVDDLGEALAVDAQALLAQATPILDPELRFVESREVQAKVENVLFSLASTVNLIPREVPPFGNYGTTYMTTFALGPVTFGTVPGEYVPNYAFTLREIMGGEAQFIVGLGMDWIGYAVTPDQFVKLAYIYERLLCPSRDAGEELLAVYRDIYGK